MYMCFRRLEENIINVVQEEQIKLGYRREKVSLFYPLTSLNNFLVTSLSPEEMEEKLAAFFKSGESRLKMTSVKYQNERFCMIISEETVEYIHGILPQKCFLKDFVEKIGEHNCTIEDLLEIFHRYSEKVHFEKVSNGEFDYLIYFENGIPDNFRYCVTDEGCHMIYHRFTPEDYGDFEFEPAGDMPEDIEM